MFTNFFQARDELDRAILADEITLAAQALAIFRFLLSHAFYDYDKFPERYGFVNRKVWGVGNIGRLTGCSERTARDHLNALQDAKLIHRQPRSSWKSGREDDEITIVWTTFHGPDIESIPANLSPIPAVLSDQPAEVAGSFLGTKNLEEPTTTTPDVVGGSSSGPSGKTRDRAKGSTRPSSTARARKEDVPVEGFASVEEYVSDLEGCRGDLECRLDMDPGEIDVLVMARKLRALCIRYNFDLKWSDILRGIEPGHKWWWQASQKDVPAGYLLRLVELDMIQDNKDDEADDPDLESRFLELFTGREYLPGHRISELMPDMDFDTFVALKNRLLDEGKIVENYSPPNSYKLAK